jgi:hypothetical protein
LYLFLDNFYEFMDINRVHFKFTRFYYLTLPSPKERVIGSKFEMHPINLYFYQFF